MPARNTWKHLETSGNTWKHLETHGNTWKHLENINLGLKTITFTHLFIILETEHNIYIWQISLYIYISIK